MEAMTELMQGVVALSVRGGLLAVMIFAVQVIFRRHLSASWRYGLWSLLLVRLLLPAGPASSYSMHGIVEPTVHNLSSFHVPKTVSGSASLSTEQDSGLISPTESSGAAAAVDVAAVDVVAAKPDSFASAPEVKAAFILSPWAWIAVLWLAGAGWMLLRLIWTHLRLVRAMASARPVADKRVLSLLDECRATIGIQKQVRLVITPLFSTPALLGFMRPRIILPAETLNQLSLDELRMVFLHELGHLKRRDIPVAWVMQLTRIIHWFNPLVVLALRSMRHEREMACDETVIHYIGDGRRGDYGRALLRFAERSPLPVHAAGLLGIGEERAAVARRIRCLGEPPRRMRRTIAIGLLAILAAVGLTEASDPAKETKMEITIWRVGSPHRGDTPPELVPHYLQALADKHGYTLTVRSFEAKGFHEVFWAAVEENAEPDLLVADNAGIVGMSGWYNYKMDTKLGTFTGIAAKNDIRRSIINVSGFGVGGMYYLISSSRNHAQAKAFVTIDQEPKLPPRLMQDVPELTPDEKAAVSELCISAFLDSITGDGSSLEAMVDDFHSINIPAIPPEVLREASVEKVKVYGVLGTHRLALGLVTAVVDFRPSDPLKGRATLGHKTKLCIFRRAKGEWKLITMREVNAHDNNIYPMLKDLRNERPQGEEAITIKAPELVSPPDGARLPRFPQAPDMEWVGGDDRTVTYVTEVQRPYSCYGRPHVSYSDFGVFPKKTVENGETKTIKIAAPYRFGAGAQPHRWRVWAIGPYGETAISQWRHIDFSN